MLTRQEWWTAVALVAIMFGALAPIGAQEKPAETWQSVATGLTGLSAPTTDAIPQCSSVEQGYEGVCLRSGWRLVQDAPVPVGSAQETPDDPQHWAPVSEPRYAGIILRLRRSQPPAYWTRVERMRLADDIDGLALTADDPGPQSIVMAVDQLRRVATGIRARQSFSPPRLAATLESYVQVPPGERGAVGIKALERATAAAAPTPNESYLAKQMQGVMASCMAPMIWELADGAPNVWNRVSEAVHTPTDWRTDNQTFHYRGTVTGEPYTGAYIRFRNYRYDPLHSTIDYGPKRVAQDVTVEDDSKTRLIRNQSDGPVDVSYDESVSEADSFTSTVTHGMTLDLSVDSTQKISGSYAGVKASVAMQEHFGVSRTSREGQEQGEEGTHEQSLSIEFTAAPSEHYLVSISKEHAVTYQDFRVSGVADFDAEIGFGHEAGGRQRSRKPSGVVRLQGVSGFAQFVHGFDTDYPSMQGFMASAASRTKDGIACVLDPDRRRVQVSGTDQASLESNADYTVESLGQSVPDHLAHLPVLDAGDVK